MIFSQIVPWSNSDVIPQLATYWEISTDEKFENIIETKRTDGDEIYFYTSTLTVPENSTYYVRATRIFENTEANITLEPTVVSNVDTLITNNIIHRDSVRIDRPFIYINKEEFQNQDFPSFKVTTSKFRCKQDGHVATHWIVTDLSGDIIYKSLFDKYDKIEKSFEKTSELLNKTNLIFYVAHVSTNGMSSEFGKYTLINNELSFEVVGLFNNIKPFVDHKLYIKPASAINSVISSVWIKKVNEYGEITNSVPIEPNKVTGEINIPGEELKYNSTLFLDIYTLNNNKESTSKRYKLKVAGSSYSGQIIPYTYELKFQDYDPNNYRSVSLPNGFYADESPNGTLVIPSRVSGRNPKVYKTIYRSSSNGPVIDIDFGDYGVREDIDVGSVDNTVMKVMNNNILLIDCLKDGHPCFKVYSYDVVNDRYSLQREKTRTDEEFLLGTQNTITQINGEEVWYRPIGKSTVKSFNFITGIIDVVAELPGDYQTGSMFHNRKLGKIINFTSNGNVYTVDTETRKVEESADVPFKDWIGQRLKCVELMNGDVLIINQNDMSRPSSLVYYDAMLNKYNDKIFKGNVDIAHVGVITTRSTSVYVVNREISGDQRLVLMRLY